MFLWLTGCPTGVVEYTGQENGTFTSPSHPADYGNNLNCQWSIRLSDTSKSLTFDLKNVDIEQTFSGCTADTLKVCKC